MFRMDGPRDGLLKNLNIFIVLLIVCLCRWNRNLLYPIRHGKPYITLKFLCACLPCLVCYDYNHDLLFQRINSYVAHKYRAAFKAELGVHVMHFYCREYQRQLPEEGVRLTPTAMASPPAKQPAVSMRQMFRDFITSRTLAVSWKYWLVKPLNIPISHTNVNTHTL